MSEKNESMEEEATLEDTEEGRVEGSVPPAVNGSIIKAASVLFGIQAIMIVGMVWFGQRALDHFAHYSQRLSEQVKRSNQLAADTAELRKEFTNLRHHLASRTDEDVIFLKAMVAKPSLDPKLARVIAQHVERYSTLYRQDADLVLAIIAVESNFEPDVVSHMGATGLMQVMPQWKKVLGIDGELSDPETSIKYGLQILGFYQEMYKDLEMALTAYNRGPGQVDSALMRGADPRNQYAPRVLKKYKQFQGLTTSGSGSAALAAR